MNEPARRWLAFADEDCFHSHQCAEKSLKALMSERGGSLPRTHRLTDVLTALPTTLPEALPGEQEAKEALTAAWRVSDTIQGMVRS